MKQEIFGILFFPFIAWMVGGRATFSRKKAFSLFLISFFLAFIFLKSTFLGAFFHSVQSLSISLQEATSKGTAFVFGYLGGATAPFQKVLPQSNGVVLFFFQVLPIMIVMSSLSSILIYSGVLSQIVAFLSKITRRISFLSRSLTASIFLKLFFSQSETTVFMRMNLKSMSDNEILSLMSMGMSTTTLALFGFYASLCDRLGGNSLPHIITASIVNIFSAMAISELMVPRSTKEKEDLQEQKPDFDNMAHALTQGAGEGWTIMVSIAAVIIASVSIVDLFNQFISWASCHFFHNTITLQSLFGFVLAPFAWLMGIEWKESLPAGIILAEKTLLNETVAISNMAHAAHPISTQTCHILIYSICAFSNLLSIGIQISLWKILSPDTIQKARKMAPKALLVSLLAGAFSSCIASLLIV